MRYELLIQPKEPGTPWDPTAFDQLIHERGAFANPDGTRTWRLKAGDVQVRLLIEGGKPIATDLAQVAAMHNLTDLAHTLAVLHNQGVGGLFAVVVFADQKKSDFNALYAFQGGLSLPSKDYYFDEKFAKFREDRKSVV